MTSTTSETGKVHEDFDKERHEKNRQSAMNFKARPDDIFICAFPKAGTHWTFEVLRFLLAGSTDIPTQEKDDAMFSLADTEKIDAMPSPRIINTHFPFEEMSADILEKNCKIIYIVRDPRDIAASYLYHCRNLHKDIEWDSFFQTFVDGEAPWRKHESSKNENSWFEYTKCWEKGIKEHPEIPFLVLCYESMKKDPSKEAKRLAEYLGVECSEELLQKVLEKTSVGVMRSARSDDKKHFYRKGVTGDWKNHFTVAQSELFNQVFEKEMVGTDAYNLYSHSLKN